MISSSALEYVWFHRYELQQWLDKNLSLSDHADLCNQFRNNPFDAKLIIEDFKRSNDEKYRIAVHEICRSGSKIVVINGGRGMGKSAITFLLAYECQSLGRPVFFYNAFKFPPWAKGVYSMSKVPNGAFLILDEASMFANARNFDKTNQLISLLPILRHRGITVVFCTQASGLVDINVYRMADILLYKPMAVVSENFEREGLISDLDRRMIPSEVDEVYFKSKNCIMKFRHGLMPGYEGNFDKTFDKINNDDLALEFAKGLVMDANLEAPELRSILSNFGFDKSLSFWKDFCKEQ